MVLSINNDVLFQWIRKKVTVEYNQSTVINCTYAISFNTIYGGICGLNKGFSAWISLDSLTKTNCDFCIRSNTTNTQTDRPFAIFLFGK